jgi:subfamily B ATP-binding cassette protein MsbA
MKNLRIIFKYVRPYKRLISAYFTFNILSNIFSVLSLGLLSPFLLLIFKNEDALKGLGGSEKSSSSLAHLNPVNGFKQWLYDMISQPGGEIRALGVICIVVMLSVVLKNVFLYMSMYYLTPIRINIVNDMRKRMFKKILELPIGYFNDQRKGDLMSKMTNDIGQIEGSTINVLETTLREPFSILFFLIYMVILSPQLTLFLVLFLPIAGLIIGRIGRTLKKQSTQVLEKLGSILSTIDETLGGIRIIKAFNAEKKQFNKFEDENRQLFKIVSAANRRRDMASPVSEMLGVMVVVCVLWYGGRLVLHGQFLNPGDFLPTSL